MDRNPTSRLRGFDLPGSIRQVAVTILPGAAPMRAGTGPAGVLVLHGFTGSPLSMRGIAEVLVAAGFSVEMPLLPGHGTVVGDLVGTGWADWSGAAEDAYSALAGRTGSVVVVGLSMGGSLACWLAERHPEVRGIALVNPLVEAPEAAVRRTITEMVDAGTELAPGIGSDIARPGVSEGGYDETPLRAARSLFDGVEREVTPRLADITCPVLLLSSRQDHVVDPSSGDRLEAVLRGPCERHWLERSYHVATLDFDRADVEAHVRAFVERVSMGAPAPDGTPDRGPVER